MNELETFYWDKRGLNTGYIFFDDHKKMLKMVDVLGQLNIGYMHYVLIIKGNTYYGFKMWGIRKRSFDLIRSIKEVIIG